MVHARVCVCVAYIDVDQNSRNCLGLCEFQKSIKGHKLTLVLGFWISYDGRIRFVKRAGDLS